MRAYQWLMTQSNEIKDKATTPDLLIALYNRAHRERVANEANQARPSVQNFKSELKNLASMMGDLDPQPTSNPYSVSAHNTAHSAEQGHIQHPNGQQNTNPQNSNPPHSNAQSSSAQNSSTQSSNAQSSNTQSTNGAHGHIPPHINFENSVTDGLDARSLQAIRDVRNLFNLSQDSEALRLLITMGYNLVKNKFS